MKEPRILDSFALVYSSGGSGFFESRSIIRRDIAHGNFFILFPGEWHRYGPDGSTYWSEYFFVAKGPMAKMFIEQNIFTPEKAFYNVSPNPLIEYHFREALKISERGGAVNNGRACGHILSILNEVQIYSVSQNNRNDNDETIASISRMMKLQPEKEWNYELVAKRHGMSYSLFRKKFVKVTGKSPHRYHNEARTALACELLVKGYPIKEVASLVGLPDPFHFSKVFKSVTGFAPSFYASKQGRDTTPSTLKDPAV
ncbi:MAG: helix-turn-helix transcriptional regulator [Fibrobacteres bacterium]|nr:helix-turn-helix transcriptional regulator [Fibrobacterota bacterium]